MANVPGDRNAILSFHQFYTDIYTDIYTDNLGNQALWRIMNFSSLSYASAGISTLGRVMVLKCPGPNSVQKLELCNKLISIIQNDFIV